MCMMMQRKTLRVNYTKILLGICNQIMQRPDVLYEQLIVLSSLIVLQYSHGC